MSPLRILKRTVLTLVAAGGLTAGASAAVLAYPEPLYPYHVTEGRLSVYADQPFSPEKGRALLDEVNRRLALSPLDVPDSTHAIFISNTEWRRHLTFLWNGGAAGLNYYPLTRNVFIRKADIDTDMVFRMSGAPTPPPRTLAYYATHEITHSLVGMRVGASAAHHLPAWIREGVPDYVGTAGAVDIDGLTAKLKAGDAELDPQRSGTYARYRLLVAYFLERKGWTVDRLLNEPIPQAEAERMLLAGA